MSVRPKKRLGQHFLTDPGVVRQIVDAVGAPPGAPVVEIGPGEGVLTDSLRRRHPDLVALEVDPEAVAHLRARFPTLDVREADVLEVDWRALREERGTRHEDGEAETTGQQPAPLHVVGNLPYYITSPILFGLLEARAHIERAVVMVQKEVADRLASPPGSKVYGTLSVYFQLFARTTLLMDVPRHAFRPPPAVESAVVVVDLAGVTPPDVAWPALQAVVRAAFGQRRKMLRNSLGVLEAQTGRPVPDWAATRRPEAVSPDDFVALAHHFFDPSA